MSKGTSVVAAYHAALERPGVADASAAVLTEGQREARAVFGDRPLCVSLRPNLVSRRALAAYTAASETLYGAFARLEKALLADEVLRRELDLDPEEERLALADPGFGASSPSSRLDGFVSDGVIRYVEYNAESPAGMAYNDVLVAIFDRLPVLQAFRKRYRAKPLRAARRQLTVLRRAIRKHIPWTRKVREGHTTYDGKTVDLAEFVIKERERLVLKPNDEYGGKGVILGWTVEQHEWEQTLLTALTSSYVVQEKVPVPKEPFPVLLDRMHFLDLSIDCDPYLFWGTVGGQLTRLSSSALL